MKKTRVFVIPEVRTRKKKIKTLLPCLPQAGLVSLQETVHLWWTSTEVDPLWIN
jgi:hypothetical protein